MTTPFGQPAPPPPTPVRVRVVMALAVALFAVLAGLGISWGIRQWGSGSAATGTGAGGSPGASGGTGSSPGDTRLRVDVPGSATSCGNATTAQPYAVKAGNSKTSCAFALAVRTAYAASAPSGGAAVVDAVSPVTKKKYAMSCTDTIPVLCTGGDGAVVYLVHADSTPTP